MTELYNIFVDIEKKFMKKECKEVDQAECLVLYTRNQFLREFRRLMDTDECLTLKF